jgi:hypothetical protein
MINERRVNVTDIMMIAATRGMMGAGIGLLAAGRLTDEQRVAVGKTLLLVGAVTTIPLAMRVFRQQDRSAARPVSSSRGAISTR